MSVWSLAGSLGAPARRPALGLVLLDEARGHGARARCPLAGGPGALGGGGGGSFGGLWMKRRDGMLWAQPEGAVPAQIGAWGGDGPGHPPPPKTCSSLLAT